MTNSHKKANQLDKVFTGDMLGELFSDHKIMARSLIYVENGLVSHAVHRPGQEPTGEIDAVKFVDHIKLVTPYGNIPLYHLNQSFTYVLLKKLGYRHKDIIAIRDVVQSKKSCDVVESTDLTAAKKATQAYRTRMQKKASTTSLKNLVAKFSQ